MILYFFYILSAHNNWWVYPILGQLIGGGLGGLIYMLTVEIHHPIDEDDTAADTSSPDDVEAREAGEAEEAANGSSPRAKN